MEKFEGIGMTKEMAMEVLNSLPETYKNISMAKEMVMEMGAKEVASFMQEGLYVYLRISEFASKEVAASYVGKYAYCSDNCYYGTGCELTGLTLESYYEELRKPLDQSDAKVLDAAYQAFQPLLEYLDEFEEEDATLEDVEEAYDIADGIQHFFHMFEPEYLSMTRFTGPKEYYEEISDDSWGHWEVYKALRDAHIFE